MEKAVLVIVAGYIIGSVPFGYVLVRLACGKDVRDCGSHNIGAVNVYRLAGPWLGALTLLLDAGKAVVMVVVAAALTGEPAVTAAAAFSVMVGHAYSAWFLLSERRLSGGKSVASGIGVLAALAALGALPWWSALLPVGVWSIGLVGPRLVTGRWWCVSMATLPATLCLPVAISASHRAPPYLALSLAMAALILARHVGNLARLRAGAEPRLGQRLRPKLGSPVTQ